MAYTCTLYAVRSQVGYAERPWSNR